MPGSVVAGTAPHIEINYGLVPDVQVHAICRFSFFSPVTPGKTAYGPGDIELGVKYRCMEEGALRPQIGVFPLIQAPTADSSRGLGLGIVQFFLPIWLQKSFGPWTACGGGGRQIYINQPALDAWLFGWELQRDCSPAATVGAELFTLSRESGYAGIETAFNIGAIVNMTADHHLLFSAGRDISGVNRLTTYFAYQYTFGPAKER